MLSPSSHRDTVGSSTPSQLRNAVAGLWSSVVTTTSVPNHGIPVATNYEKLLEKHASVLQQLKLSESEMADIVEHGFHRLQHNLRDCRAQTNATVQQMGIHMMRDLHEDIRLEQAQAKILQRRKDVASDNQQLRIAQELAEARIKARQALNLNATDSKDEDDSDEGEEEEQAMQQPSPTSVMADAAFVQLTPQQKNALNMVHEEDEDDDDIQELDE